MHDQYPPCPRMLQYRPPRIAMSLALAAALLQLLTRVAWDLIPAAPAAGFVVAATGFGVMLRAWWLFRRFRTAICPTAQTTTLITDDIYRITRNPMYLGITLLLLGVAVATGSPFFYVATVSFFLIIDFVFCRYEENKLDDTFGTGYSDYRRKVRRWL